MQIHQFPRPVRADLRLALEASKKSQAEAKARSAMHDALQRVMATTRQEFQLKEMV